MGRFLVGLVALASLAGCECEGGPRQGLAEVPELPVPACVEGEPTSVDAHVLRAGPHMQQRDVVERFELRPYASGCRVIRVKQEWSLGTADLDVAFDAEGLPLRVWRRTTIPDASGPLGHLDLRVFDLSQTPVRLARRASNGDREGVALRGARPRAVIGPGRGLLTAWIQRADLAVGEQVREPVLDMREPVALIRDVTLRREVDRDVEDLGRVRVYTIYGREAVYTDDAGVIVGDLMGLRPADRVPGPLPDPLPDRGPIDPSELP